MLLETETIPQHVWPAGTRVAEWLLRQPDDLFADAHVLEIGSGVGVGGLALMANTRVRSMTLTDGSDVSVALLHVTANCPSNLEASLQRGADLHVARLKWANAGHADAIISHHSTHYRSPSSAPFRFDVVLGCDVFYFQSSLVSGLAAARRLLRPGGLFVCASFVRSDRMDCDLESLPEKHGFAVEGVDQVANDERDPLRVFRWRRLSEETAAQ